MTNQNKLKRIILEDDTPVPPFNEPANQLTIGTKPLRVYHEELMRDYFAQRDNITVELGKPINDRMQVYLIQEPAIVYRDSLWFDEEFLDAFITGAAAEEEKEPGRAYRAAVYADDLCYQTYTFRLAHNTQESYIDEKDEDGKFQRTRKVYKLDLWYLPNGIKSPNMPPIIIESDYKEKGFYTVPDFMATDRGDLTHYLPKRAVIFIETWFHVYVASIIFGVFTRASRLDDLVEESNLFQLRLLWQAVIEQKQVLSTSRVVKIGRGTTIHPTAVITGPATIGEYCNIGPGVVIDNCTIGDNVSIDTGCIVSLSTIGNNCFLPFRASIYLTALMDNTIVAQNTCLQMCVIGRNSFIGAGITFTDFNLIGVVERDDEGRIMRTVPRPIGAANAELKIEDTGQTVLGGAVGHNCRLGSGLIVMPGRMIESDAMLFASPQRRVISRSISFEESDHHYVKGGAEAHRRLHPRPDEELDQTLEEGWDQW